MKKITIKCILAIAVITMSVGCIDEVIGAVIPDSEYRNYERVLRQKTPAELEKKADEIDIKKISEAECTLLRAEYTSGSSKAFQIDPRTYGSYVSRYMKAHSEVIKVAMECALENGNYRVAHNDEAAVAAYIRYGRIDGRQLGFEYVNKILPKLQTIYGSATMPLRLAEYQELYSITQDPNKYKKPGYVGKTGDSDEVMQRAQDYLDRFFWKNDPMSDKEKQTILQFIQDPYHQSKIQKAKRAVRQAVGGAMRSLAGRIDGKK